MIPVSRKVLKPEPAGFDEKCRKKGAGWLARNPKTTRKDKRPKDFWSPFRLNLADAFSNLCAYGAMYEPSGSVDHFKPVNANESLAYEWRNYRFASGWINSSKNNRPKVLDAFRVKAGWFEVLLPSLQLVAVKQNIPPNLHHLVEQTLTDLHLRNDERIVRQRRAWLLMYDEGNLTLEGLRKMAPLIADAVAKRDHIAS